jgi:hypothetical protein
LHSEITIEMEGNKLIFHPNKFSNSNIGYKNKRIKIIVDNEEIYMIKMILPKVGKEKIRMMIVDELSLRFKNLESIMFDYLIYKKNKKNIDAAVFCINWNRGELLKDIVMKDGELKGVYPLQLYILKKFRRNIKEKNFYFIFLYRKSLYITAVVNDSLVMKRVIKNFESGAEKTNIMTCNDEIKYLYYANMDKKTLADYFDVAMNYVDLGSFQDSNIFE